MELPDRVYQRWKRVKKAINWDSKIKIKQSWSQLKVYTGEKQGVKYGDLQFGGHLVFNNPTNTSRQETILMFVIDS